MSWLSWDRPDPRGVPNKPSDVTGGVLDIPPNYADNSSTGLGMLANNPQTNIQNHVLQYSGADAQWTSTSTNIESTNKAFIKDIDGQIQALTMIVSENNDYLLDKIKIEHGPIDSIVIVPLLADRDDCIFKLPKGDLNHSMAKKYMDWLAMIQLIFQGD